MRRPHTQETYQTAFRGRDLVTGTFWKDKSGSASAKEITMNESGESGG